MIKQVKGKIFLSDERGHEETEDFRTYRTFNSGNYYNEHKTAFGSLYVLNDETLAGGQSLKACADENTLVLILPLAGPVEYKSDNSGSILIEAGELLVSHVVTGENFEIANPFETELVNFLHFRFKIHGNYEQFLCRKFSFNLAENENSLVPVFPANENVAGLGLSIGRFKGREETVYAMQSKKKGLFLFVIEGAFEAEGRLLHARDGLALWETGEAEIEALSNDAIILAVEVPM
jgi:quercetin 2,3-dioxygenase